jgi:hypothetical protein
MSSSIPSHREPHHPQLDDQPHLGDVLGRDLPVISRHRGSSKVPCRVAAAAAEFLGAQPLAAGSLVAWWVP